jgi:hypothetical protein
MLPERYRLTTVYPRRRNFITANPQYITSKLSSMKRTLILTTAFILILWSCTGPVQAFTAKNLDVAVQGSGDAIITFDYELSWFENIAVFMHIADPAIELKKALESNFNKPVEVIRADGGESRFTVQGFATVKVKDGTTTMKTPGLSFAEAQKVLEQYWFAPLVSPDFSPEVTLVRFPDGYVEEFDNQISIPPVTHTLQSAVPGNS